MYIFNQNCGISLQFDCTIKLVRIQPNQVGLTVNVKNGYYGFDFSIFFLVKTNLTMLKSFSLTFFVTDSFAIFGLTCYNSIKLNIKR